MQTSTVRVLVVDDFELWQNFVHMQLDREANLQVIGVAGDGHVTCEEFAEAFPSTARTVKGRQEGRRQKGRM